MLKIVSEESPLCNSFITIHQNYFQGVSQRTHLDIEQAVSETRDHRKNPANKQLLSLLLSESNWHS